MLTIINEGSSLTIVNKGSSLTIVNKGLSLTIINKTTNFIKTGVSGKTKVLKKNYMQLYIECRLAWSLTVVGELKLLDIFLKTTQHLVQIVNEGSSLTMVNETMNFIKMIVLKSTIISVFDFSSLFT